MRPSPKLFSTFWNTRQRVAPALSAITALVATVTLVACGGGGGSPAATTSPTATPLFASGPITGFGSVIINGVRFDDTAATIDDDDGHALVESALRLGMHAEIDGDANDGDASRGTAHAIHIRSALIGPVSAVDMAAGTLTVLGQTVTVDAQTAFDTALVGGLAAVTAGAVVQVHGAFDAVSQSYLATRIDIDAAATHYKIRGTVTALDASAKTLQIGATALDFSTTADVPSTLAVGSLIVARLATTPVAGVWTATAIADGHPSMHDHDEAHLRGVISAFTSATQFSVDGNPVDATNAAFPNGQSAVVLGAKVEVEGQLVGGVVIATKVGIEDQHDHDHDGQRVELHGTIGALDTTALTFVVRGVTVSYAGSVAFQDGTAATLANGLFVEVHGGLSPDGTVVDATRIELKPAD